MTKTTTTTQGDLDALLATVHAAIGSYLGIDGTVTVVQDGEAEPAVEAAPAAKGKGKKAARPAPVKEEKAVAPAKTEKARRKQLAGMDDDALRALCVGYDYEDADVADADTSDLIDAILGEEFPADADEAEETEEADDSDEDEAEDDDEEDDDDEEKEEGDSRESLSGLNLRELKAKAKEAGYATSDLKNMDQDAIIDLLLDEAEDEDADEEEPEDEDDESDEAADDEEEADEEEWYSEAQLKAMSIKELRDLADEYEIEHDGLKKADLVAALVE